MSITVAAAAVAAESIGRGRRRPGVHRVVVTHAFEATAGDRQPARGDVAPAEPSPGAARLRALITSGVSDPRRYGNVIANFPAERAALVAELQRHLGNQATGDALAWADRKGTRAIGYLSMLGSASKRALLQQINADQGGVVAINAEVADPAYDTDAEIDAAIDGWPLAPTARETIRSFCRGEPRGPRLRLCRLFVEAELGQRRLERLILTGHSGSESIFNGFSEILFDELTPLRDALPVGFGQVKHLLVGACSTGYQASMEVRYPALFPNLVTAWAYGGSAPGPHVGGNAHTKIWEKATERRDASRIDRASAEAHRKGENVSTWSARDGFDGSLIARQDADEARFAAVAAEAQRYIDGELTDETPDGTLRQLYQSLLATSNSTSVPDHVRAEAGEVAAVALRVLYWREVQTRFMATHGAQVRRLYEHCGVPMPAFETIKRSAVGAEMTKLFQAIDALSAPLSDELVTCRDLLIDGLLQLSSRVIPDTWL